MPAFNILKDWKNPQIVLGNAEKLEKYFVCLFFHSQIHVHMPAFNILKDWKNPQIVLGNAEKLEKFGI